MCYSIYLQMLCWKMLQVYLTSGGPPIEPQACKYSDNTPIQIKSLSIFHIMLRLYLFKPTYIFLVHLL